VLVGVHVGLVEEHDLAEPLLDATLGHALAHVLALVLGLLDEDPHLGLARLGGHVGLAQVLRGGRRDVEGHVARELAEVVVAGHEVGLAVDLHEHADLAVRVDVALHDALRRHALATLGGARLPLDPQQLDRALHVARALLERALAVHHARARALPERLDVPGGYGGGHDAAPWVCWFAASSVAA
jgi:hypothetical protein